MIDNSNVLYNPLVPPGFYFAKVIRIVIEPADYFFPKLLVKLQLHPSYGFDENYIFSAILFPTDKSYFHYKNFFNSYMLDTDDFNKAIGRYASVEIYNSEYGDIKYSAVRFCYQPREIWLMSGRIERAEKKLKSKFNS